MAINTNDFQGFYATSSAKFNEEAMEAGALYLVENESTIGLAGHIPQYEMMPIVDHAWLNRIILYTGPTDENYTNGCFYICKQVTENLPEDGYHWVLFNINNKNITFKIATAETAGIVKPGNYLTIDEGTLAVDPKIIIQYENLPEANEENLGRIVQYVGRTNVKEQLYKGLFYRCSSSATYDMNTGEATFKYYWDKTSVQDNPEFELVVNLPTQSQKTDTFYLVYNCIEHVDDNMGTADAAAFNKDNIDFSKITLGAKVEIELRDARKKVTFEYCESEDDVTNIYNVAVVTTSDASAEQKANALKNAIDNYTEDLDFRVGATLYHVKNDIYELEVYMKDKIETEQLTVKYILAEPNTFDLYIYQCGWHSLMPKDICFTKEEMHGVAPVALSDKQVDEILNYYL